MIYLKKTNIALLLIVGAILSGCGSKYRYDYSVHKPKVRFKPSVKALDRLRYETMGHPYVWGAENDGCYDCSGLTFYTLGSMGIEIPRVANDQFHHGTPVAKSDLQKGDLVFFATSRRRPGVATHVGIYIGNGKFQHASSAKGRVMVSSLYSPYWVRTYLGARRYHNFNNYYQPRYQYAQRTPSYTKPFREQRVPQEQAVQQEQFASQEMSAPSQNPVVQRFSSNQEVQAQHQEEQTTDASVF